MDDRIKSLKERFVGIVESQVNGNLEKVDAKELGEVVDIIKDLAETSYYCAVTEAMSEADPETKTHYMGKYAPETNRYYSRRYPNDDTYMRDMDRYNGRMYFTEPTRMRDPRDGRSPIARRMYMDNKHTDASTRNREMDNYLNELSMDLSEMINDLDATEKATLKQKIATLANKIV